jgi:hypothetical protein
MPEPQNRVLETKERLLGHEPAWWQAVVGLIQLCVITILLGGINWFLALRDKENQVIVQGAKLSDPAPMIYTAALDVLLGSGSRGNREIRKYIAAHASECQDWNKAVLIGSKQWPVNNDPEGKSAVVRMIQRSWICQGDSLLKDARWLELTSVHENDEMCESLVEIPKSDKGRIAYSNGRNASRLHLAALITILSKCKTFGGSEHEKQLNGFFREQFPPPNGVEYNFYTYYFTYGSSPLPTLEELSKPNLERMDDLANGIVRQYKGISDPTLALKEAYGESELWERLIFLQHLFRNDKSDSKEMRELFSFSERHALKSRDSFTRVVAILTAAQSDWTRYRNDLDRLACCDPDPKVSRYAENVVTKLGSLNLMNGLHLP